MASQASAYLARLAVAESESPIGGDEATMLL
jgi:hypothetical protein